MLEGFVQARQVVDVEVVHHQDDALACVRHAPVERKSAILGSRVPCVDVLVMDRPFSLLGERAEGVELEVCALVGRRYSAVKANFGRSRDGHAPRT